jgi:hypothetical protein
LKSAQVDRIVAIAAGQEAAMSWTAACGVEAKWHRAGHNTQKESDVDEFIRGGLGPEELTLTLFKGLWHALEPGKSFMTSDFKRW